MNKTPIRKPAAAPSINPWDVAVRQLDAVARHLKLDPGIHKYLRIPKRILTVSIPVKNRSIRALSSSTSSRFAWTSGSPGRWVSARARWARALRYASWARRAAPSAARSSRSSFMARRSLRDRSISDTASANPSPARRVTGALRPSS